MDLESRSFGGLTARPVNVASVPQRSPFRYAGGKTWFVPAFREWMSQMPASPGVLVEPFAGGGIISLTALFEDWVPRAVMVERDEEVAAVWQSVANGDARGLADRILSFDLSRESVVRELGKAPESSTDRAFQTILKNRTFRGGILAEGAGFMRFGEGGRGIGSRWYPDTLAKRILSLDRVANRIQFRCGDGLEVMEEFASHEDAVYFIDPPYTAGGKRAGKRLYRYSDIDHERLFIVCKSLRGDFLLTYDVAGEVEALARDHGFDMRLIPMTSTHHATMEELVIGRDLSWMDRSPRASDPMAASRLARKKS